ncbi:MULTISPECIES: TIGR03619 family F420-dependent LLM class oxidoreductase [Streptomyces]|uniref:TIGR03619 family F420-dependent LLM class oxidoreductase n=1 Tax=Streptomyces caniscabiei TaxID=2746961 RepID=A0ABU4N4T8_9ACTN|nr:MULTISPECIES: TIGR03619 family F420-dependent LLM class oxidoreductase [Streptomyces]MBE4741950.1 TIGR03619 family F420-dependent LLM class oxidoreductase [Streptomyces caniscabiei]MBE4762718.1 TIGR03619 family F420-dependent LLM class oxidoreductase [Streptomyces caniscabiei]MBE4775961.1 TIGR03619 family F420-dependent LLM class oxidoreductase [Streptomyces caniscabiei]MBE4790776.1 TIGR03619 family F420-dependent LLM class oxidoreductase [Streptomyces caniscabiei]MBE4799939.1 TIGR03619 fam
MKLQVVLPNEVAGSDPRRLADLALQAEALGYDTAWLPDHILPPDEYGPVYGGVLEPLVTMGWLAATTSRIRFGTSVLVLPLRSPFVVAKQVATLHELSGGRITLGVGIGWEQREFAAVGAEFKNRAGRTDEAIALLRHLFRVGRGPFEGHWYGFETGVFEPRPDREVPLMTGGVTDAALRRAARYADVWQGVGLDPTAFGERLAFLRTRTDGRTVSPGTRMDWHGPDRTAGEAARTAVAFQAAGAEHLAVHFGPPDGYERRMAAFARGVLQRNGVRAGGPA